MTAAGASAAIQTQRREMTGRETGEEREHDRAERDRTQARRPEERADDERQRRHVPASPTGQLRTAAHAVDASSSAPSPATRSSAGCNHDQREDHDTRRPMRAGTKRRRDPRAMRGDIVTGITVAPREQKRLRVANARTRGEPDIVADAAKLTVDRDDAVVRLNAGAAGVRVGGHACDDQAVGSYRSDCDAHLERKEVDRKHHQRKVGDERSGAGQ